MTAEIIQFAPRPNPERDISCQLNALAAQSAQQNEQGAYLSALRDQVRLRSRSQLGSIGHPWPGEDKA